MSELGKATAIALRDLPETPWPQLEAYRHELAALNEQLNAAWAQREQLYGEREIAERDDRAAQAQALRAGEEAPKTRKVAKVDAQVAALDEKIEALRLAIDTAADEAADAIVEIREQQAAELNNAVGEALSVYRQTVTRLLEARTQATATIALRNWLKQFPDRPGFSNAVPGLAGIRAQHGGPTGWAEVAAALTVDLEPGELRREPYTLREHVEASGRTAAAGVA